MIVAFSMANAIYLGRLTAASGIPARGEVSLSFLLISFSNCLYTKKPSKRPGEFLYIYFSKKLCEGQLHKKDLKFSKRMAKGDELIEKAKKHRHSN